MRRKLLIGATLAVAVLSAWTIAGLAVPRGCFREHLPKICMPGPCRVCGGFMGSKMEAMCGRCAAVRGVCSDCGEPLRSGVEGTLARIFER